LAIDGLKSKQEDKMSGIGKVVVNRTFRVSVVIRTVPCYIDGTDKEQVERAVREVFKDQGGVVMVNIAPANRTRGSDYAVSPEGELVPIKEG
jgi:hypothetical protein